MLLIQILWKIFELIKDNITEKWRQRKIKELETVYDEKYNIIETNKKRRQGWAGVFFEKS